MKYLLYSLKYSNGIACWWRPDSRGYTEDIYQAGRYTKEEVDKICIGGWGSAVGIPEDIVFEKMKPTVKIDEGWGQNSLILKDYKDAAARQKIEDVKEYNLKYPEVLERRAQEKEIDEYPCVFENLESAG